MASSQKHVASRELCLGQFAWTNACIVSEHKIMRVRKDVSKCFGGMGSSFEKGLLKPCSKNVRSKLDSPLCRQGGEVLGQADGRGHGQAGQGHHPVCHRDGQVSGLRQDAVRNLQTRFRCKGMLLPAPCVTLPQNSIARCVRFASGFLFLDE